MLKVLEDIKKLQNEYNDLVASGSFTKKDLCNLVVPFRDKYSLSDRDALSIARSDASISEIVDMLS